MIFSLKRPVKIVLIGAGGTGGHVAPQLYRLLYALDRPVKIIICDGDIVEEKNLVRQNFSPADLGENKARVTAERYSTAYGMETAYVPDFIETTKCLEDLIRPATWEGSRFVTDPKTNRTYRETITELVILIGAVDNNRSRQLCHEVFTKAKDLIYIDSGNGEYTGQVVCGIRRNGRTYYQPVANLHPELFDAEDVFPSAVSCGDATVSAPQTIVANLMAATAIVTIVYNILVLGSNTVQQTTFSTKTVNIRSMKKQTCTRRKAA